MCNRGFKFEVLSSIRGFRKVLEPSTLVTKEDEKDLDCKSAAALHNSLPRRTLL